MVGIAHHQHSHDGNHIGDHHHADRHFLEKLENAQSEKIKLNYVCRKLIDLFVARVEELLLLSLGETVVAGTTYLVENAVDLIL